MITNRIALSVFFLLQFLGATFVAAQQAQDISFHAELATQVSTDSGPIGGVYVRIDNAFGEALDLEWMDHRGLIHSMGAIVPGGSRTYDSTTGHLFRLQRRGVTEANFRVTQSPIQRYRAVPATQFSNTNTGTGGSSAGGNGGQPQALSFQTSLSGQASINSGPAGVSVNLTNKAREIVLLEWVDHNKVAQKFAAISPGETFNFQSTPGHLFLIKRGLLIEANFRVTSARVQNYSVDTHVGVVPKGLITAKNVSEISIKDPATGLSYTLKKDANSFWTGTHPAFVGTGLRMTSSVGDSENSILNLANVFTENPFYIQVDIAGKTISHTEEPPVRLTDGSLAYFFMGHFVRVTFK